jgi:hypothetical protein
VPSCQAPGNSPSHIAGPPELLPLSSLDDDTPVDVDVDVDVVVVVVVDVVVVVVVVVDVVVDVVVVAAEVPPSSPPGSPEPHPNTQTITARRTPDPYYGGEKYVHASATLAICPSKNPE